MDIMMPGMDGYATMRAIRLLDAFAGLPIIAVTGKVMDGERERCVEAGANDYVPKPVDTVELLAAIGPWLPALVYASPVTRRRWIRVGRPILMIDDNPTKRFALRAILEPLGFPIVEASSGLDGLRCLVVQDFAVILLDVRMPVMDGFETAALIRQRKQSELTPIIFITAHSKDEFEQADHYAQGAVDFMMAPVAPDELRAKVKVFAQLFAQAAVLAVQARALQTASEEMGQLNRELTAIARRDPLTGLRNRRALSEDLEMYESHAAAVCPQLLHGDARHRSLQGL